MVLNAIFGFLLAFPPIVSVALFAIIVLILVNIFYKILIKQSEAKQLKERTQELSKEMRKEQKAGNTDKASKLMSEMMQEQGKLMRMSLKPMIVSLVIVILLLPWLADNYGDRFAVLEDNTGSIVLGEQTYSVTRTENMLSIAGAETISCSMPCLEQFNRLYEISQEGERIKFAPVVALMPVPLPFFGSTLGWLGWYVLASLPLAILVRKFMKIYV